MSADLTPFGTNNFVVNFSKYQNPWHTESTINLKNYCSWYCWSKGVTGPFYFVVSQESEGSRPNRVELQSRNCREFRVCDKNYRIDFKGG